MKFNFLGFEVTIKKSSPEDKYGSFGSQVNYAKKSPDVNTSVYPSREVIHASNGDTYNYDSDSSTLSRGSYSLGKFAHIVVSSESDNVSINSTSDVVVEGDFRGNVRSCSDFSCDGSVHGNVEAGGDVSCEDITGNVKSGGDINCSSIKGNVSCSDLSAEDISAETLSASDISCGDISGNITCRDIECGDVTGNVSGNDITCGDVTGNVSSKGMVRC
mgnify:CR=1 FL=1